VVTVILPTDLLINRPVLSAAMVAATGQVMAEHFGKEPREWEKSYRNVLGDWDNYWRDLDLNGDASLRHWREGRWRVAKALFRLTGFGYPPETAIPLHLDQLPRELGRLCAEAWKQGVAEGIAGLAGTGARAVILAPTLPAALLRGMAEGADLAASVAGIIGPDQLERVGLEGFEWRWLCSLARGDAGQTVLVNAGDGLVPGARLVAPPDDLSRLADVLANLSVS
jgi:hypothetical protein